MSVGAKFPIPSADFTLHHALTAAPEMVVEIERVAATMEYIAMELGISRQALAKRLHHGHTNLITNTLTVSSASEA